MTLLFKSSLLMECVVLTVTLSFPSLWSSWDLAQPLSVGFMVDKLSGSLIILTLWLTVLTLFISVDNMVKVNMMVLCICLVGYFSVTSLVWFFMLFEVSLIPTVCLIKGWGYQPERLEASKYFIFYTITFSLPLLSSLIWFTEYTGMAYLPLNSSSIYCSSHFTFFVLLIFMIKLPMFMYHFWLPKAHVEAPVVGSMILAGILLKTGGYGVVRMMVFLKKGVATWVFSTMSSVGMVLICMICLSCVDLKQVIAYSSVSHMNFMVMGMMSPGQVSYSGCIIMMISHGLSSSMMFMMADFMYKRTTTRSLMVNKGILISIPSFSMLWGITMMFNMGFPPTPGSISELLVISSLHSFNTIYSCLIFLYLFFAAFYSVHMYISVSHGESVVKSFQNLDVKELLASVTHLVSLSGIVLLSKMTLL